MVLTAVVRLIYLVTRFHSISLFLQDMITLLRSHTFNVLVENRVEVSLCGEFG